MPDNIKTSLSKTFISMAFVLALLPGTAMAQDITPPSERSSAQYVDALKQCQEIVSDPARLSCYDSAVDRVVAATDKGELRVINREDMKSTRRKLFGFSLPDLGLFGNDDTSDDRLELLQSTVTSVSYRQRRAITLVIAEGNAVWRIANPPRRLRRIEVGDTVIFKPAALGSYWIRINGQSGVKARRIR